MLTRGTFYQHYLDKYDLLTDVFRQLTLPTSAITYEVIFLQPSETMHSMASPVLFSIFKKQSHDPEFQEVQRGFYISYYTKLLEPMNWQSPCPKASLLRLSSTPS